VLACAGMGAVSAYIQGLHEEGCTMKRTDGERDDGENKPLTWRERLIRWRNRTLSSEAEEEARWVDEVMADLEVPLPENALASAKQTYLQRLYRRLAVAHTCGLEDVRHVLQMEGERLDLVALYQPLNTTVDVPCEEEERETEGRALLPVLTRTRPLTLLEAVNQADRALVRGSHGTGKSTFLRYLALCMSEQAAGGEPLGESPAMQRLEPVWQHGQLFPLWVNLRAYREASQGSDAAVDLCAYIAAQMGIESDQLCWQVLGPGGILLLLDGLEHAPDAAAAFLGGLAEVGEAASARQSIRVIVTAQPYVAHGELGDGALAGYTEIDLAPWRQQQMDGYARAWYAELLRKGWIGEEAARDLPGQLALALRRDEVRRLAQRPSLMAVIALLHTVHQRLPPEPVLFYHQLVDVAISIWSEGHPGGAADAWVRRDLRHVVDTDALRAIIAQITYQGQDRLEGAFDRVRFQESDLRAALLTACRDGRWESANELVTRILARPSLLDEEAPGVYVFVERDLQVYIASRHLAAQPGLAQLVVELVEDDFYRWRDVARFAVARLARLNGDPAAAFALIEALAEQAAPPDEVVQLDEAEWRMVWLAGEMLASLAQSFRLEGHTQLLHRIRDRLAMLLSEGRLVPLERAQGGRALDRLPGGDTRPGVTAPEGLWCEVPAGPAWIGEGDQARLVDSAAFWMARYPVTNAQYTAFVAATGHAPPSHWRGNLPLVGTGNHPIVNVTWEDAVAYCTWWNEHARRRALPMWRPGEPRVATQPPRAWQARLPTSVEWEKTARGGLVVPTYRGDGGAVDNPLPRRRYPWGDQWTLSTPGLPGDEMRCNVSESNIGTTTPVGMYPSGASPYDVLDLAGNVWEWCLEWADEEHRFKVRRGGAFRYTHEQARCSASDRAHPGLGWPYVGFRLVIGPPVQDST
jgi:formylglycine-generating enzyme required for sulfatase activity